MAGGRVGAGGTRGRFGRGVANVLVNLQVANMGWAEFMAWEGVQPEGQEPDKREGATVAEMLNGDVGEEKKKKKKWAEELVKECEERDKLIRLR